MSNALGVLVQARSLILHPEKWTRGVYARDINGEPTDPKNSDAARFCALGALRAVTPDNMEGWTLSAVCQNILDAALPAFSDRSYTAGFNDLPETRHEDVLSLYDHAIAKLKAGAA